MDPVKINLVPASNLSTVGAQLLLVFLIASLIYLIWVLISWNKKANYEPSMKGFVIMVTVFTLILGTTLYGRFVDYSAQEEAVTQALSQVAEISGVKFVNTSDITYKSLTFPDQETPISFTKDGRFSSGILVSTAEGIILAPRETGKAETE